MLGVPPGGPNTTTIAGRCTIEYIYNYQHSQVFTDETYQSKAEAACHDSGAQLASVHSEDENKYVESRLTWGKEKTKFPSFIFQASWMLRLRAKRTSSGSASN